MVGIRQKRWNQNSFRIDSLPLGHLEGLKTDKREAITHQDGACDFHSWMHEGDCHVWGRTRLEEAVGVCYCYHFPHGEMFSYCPALQYWECSGSLRHSRSVFYGKISHWGLDQQTWAGLGPTGQPSAAQSCFSSLHGGHRHPQPSQSRAGETWSGHSIPPGRPRTQTDLRACSTHWDWGWLGVRVSSWLGGFGFSREFSPSRISGSRADQRVIAWSWWEPGSVIFWCQFENHILKSLHSSCAAINKLFNLQDLRIRWWKVTPHPHTSSFTSQIRIVKQ